MKKKVLIAYATRAGSTAEIAAEIGETLNDRGFSVDVKPFRHNPDPAGYQAVFLGSGVRMGSWLPEAVKYVKENRNKLIDMPAVLFTVHMLNTGSDDKSLLNRLAYLDNVRPLLKNPLEVYFEGVMDYSKLSFLDRKISKMVGAEEADNRDWERIQGWASEIHVTEVDHEK